MSNSPSFERINYTLRPNKQVERKMIIDILSRIDLDINLSNYVYVGMGSIYYYDFVLMHKFFGLKNMISIDNKDTIKRFSFNKPYDFVEFRNCLSSTYLFSHNYHKRTIFWLDYDGHVKDVDALKTDIGIIGRNAGNNDFYLTTVNCEAPIEEDAKKDFLRKFKNYISPELNDIKNIAAKKFPLVVQDIISNMLDESTEYNNNKFNKLCSFIYKDGALMYTLGGIFSDKDNFVDKYLGNNYINNDRQLVTEIKLPNITYKEKFYLDANIDAIELLLKYAYEYMQNMNLSKAEQRKKLNDFLGQELEFEIGFGDLSNYVRNYRFVPQYYEGII